MEYSFGRSSGVGEAQDVVEVRGEKTKCGSGGEGGVWDGYFVEKRVKKRGKSGVFFFKKIEKNLAI